MKTAIREMYESAVKNAWIKWDECEIQIYQNYSEAVKLGQLQPDDKTSRDKNLALVQNWDSLAKQLNDLWDSYHNSNDGQPRLKSLAVYTCKLASCNYVPQLEDGRFFISKIRARSIAACYLEVQKYFEQYPDLYYRKYHRGARILIPEGDLRESELFTVHKPEMVSVL
jgi:hypothetical protein